MAKVISLIITGRVQGVFFRVSTQTQATKLNLSGFVRNQPDGSVYIEVSGAPSDLHQFTAWCHQGLKYARVDSVSLHSIKSFSLPIEPRHFLIL